jgi:CRISPR-associated protein Csx17
LAWLDAAVVLGEEKPQFPPLLGTGGNDGRLDFSNNFMQRVVACIEDGDALRPSLFGTSKSLRFQGTMGMYAPASDIRSNPWDFVLLLEGSLLFAGAATRRLASASPGSMAFPFHARAAGGNSSLAPTDEDKSRDELWLPLWSKGSTLREIHALLAEGRAKVGIGAGERQDERDANTALDFARAVSRVGTDRGVTAFARVGFHERNGLAYYATPLGRYSVGDIGAARLLDELDGWLARFRRAALGDRAPATVARGASVLEDAMFAMVAGGSAADLLLALSQVELTLARSLSFTENAYLSPLPTLTDAWQLAIDDSVEARLGRALGGCPGLRRRFLPLDANNPRRWGRADDTGVVFGDRSAIDNLHALLLRDDLDSQQEPAGISASTSTTRWADLCAFIDGDVDDELVERWAMATTLLPASEVVTQANYDDDGHWPPATYAVLKLVHHGALTDDTPVKRTPTMLARACAGDAEGATRVALQRLNAVGRPLPVSALVESPVHTRRIAAALAFPLSWSQRRRLERMVLSPSASDSHEELQ